MLAPIVLFVYNRPWHTNEVLNALAKNQEASQSTIYIFSDGLKKEANDETIRMVKETREIIKRENRFKFIHIVEQSCNKGLANSIIDGVNSIVNEHGKVIVLEDDIVCNKGFLKYMNEALNLYAVDENVGCVHAWNYDLDTNGQRESTFFLKGADCWGWGTWKRAWNKFEKDGQFLLDSITTNNMQFEFNRKGTHTYTEMLKQQIEGKNDSWAIRWHASLFLANNYCLQPTTSIVKNIGLDKSGIHCGFSEISQNPIDIINLNKIEIKESDWFYNSYKIYDEKQKNVPSINNWKKMKNFVKRITNK